MATTRGAQGQYWLLDGQPVYIRRVRLCGGAVRGVVIMVDGLDGRSDWCNGGGRRLDVDLVVASRPTRMGAQKRRGALGGFRQAIMGEEELEGRGPTAAGCVDARSADGPIHGVRERRASTGRLGFATARSSLFVRCRGHWHRVV